MLNLHERLAAKLKREWDRQESEGSRVLLFGTHQEEFLAVFAEDWSYLRPGLELPVANCYFRVTTGLVTLLRPKRPADAPLCSSSQCR
jgi:hypothetical protein